MNGENLEWPINSLSGFVVRDMQMPPTVFSQAILGMLSLNAYTHHHTHKLPN